eukprot:CAMPEP_0202882766 /NCGR_PEP_ID=MMETSP1391-20130828/38488_1 /ASSEMBLY_ACC=CAM_ASM_000867 /TAXON_ID=1034604 /ORGANISM="Chlamydomonas leiostraca, Strain SAG 11-49" /LENGTH=57 /DNA_ID=CAMNT_0049565683 /DNA_START=78 /DNA_END=248 /DNA_ORIENTATION=+
MANNNDLLSEDVRNKLEQYRAAVEKIKAEGTAKPDMVAYSQLKEKLTPEAVVGPIEG